MTAGCWCNAKGISKNCPALNELGVGFLFQLFGDADNALW